MLGAEKNMLNALNLAPETLADIVIKRGCSEVFGNSNPKVSQIGGLKRFSQLSIGAAAKGIAWGITLHF